MSGGIRSTICSPRNSVAVSMTALRTGVSGVERLGVAYDRGPVVAWYSGAVLVDSTNAEVRQALGVVVAPRMIRSPRISRPRWQETRRCTRCSSDAGAGAGRRGGFAQTGLFGDGERVRRSCPLVNPLATRRAQHDLVAVDSVDVETDGRCSGLGPAVRHRDAGRWLRRRAGGRPWSAVGNGTPAGRRAGADPPRRCTEWRARTWTTTASGLPRRGWPRRLPVVSVRDPGVKHDFVRKLALFDAAQVAVAVAPPSCAV
jgi:hypothetical protein